jgi:Transposase
MKASKFTDAQKAFILKQGADGHPVAEICRKAGISEATYFASWTFGSIGRRSTRGCCLTRCGG